MSNELEKVQWEFSFDLKKDKLIQEAGREKADNTSTDKVVKTHKNII